MKKIGIVITDGVGVKNFMYSKFYYFVKQKFDVTFINFSSIESDSLKDDNIITIIPKINFLTEIIKNSIKYLRLKKSYDKTGLEAYKYYHFKNRNNSFSNLIKNQIFNVLCFLFNSSKGILFLEHCCKFIESKTRYHFEYFELIKEKKLDLLFFSNQRHSTTIALCMAAKKCGIPSISFIFSWDNLPKATKVIDTDYYFVWSNYMKKELLYYYPEINENQIKVTGTPQFEFYYEKENIIDKTDFFEKYSLDLNKQYICYSGDDITTCPDDPQYLYDITKAIEELNLEGYNLGIIFRKCPVDFSNRYDEVIHKFSHIIKPINPDWERSNNNWHGAFPHRNDINILSSTIYYSQFVINLGSSMVFDFAIFNKPCMYIKYDVINKINEKWSVSKIYSYIHFASMPSKEAVIWLENKNEIKNKIKQLLNNKPNVNNAKIWFNEINMNPYNDASKRILLELQKIAN